MSVETVQHGTPYNLTATGNVGIQTVPQSLIGFYVNNTTSGTLVIKDGASAKTGTITPAIGFHAFPASFKGGLNVTIGGTLDVTFFVVDGQY